MSGLPDLVALGLRPLLIVAVGAVIYRMSKAFCTRQYAARIAFVSTSLLFVIDLAMIAYPDLLFATALSTALGVAFLAFILRKRAFNG